MGKNVRDNELMYTTEKWIDNRIVSIYSYVAYNK